MTPAAARPPGPAEAAAPAARGAWWREPRSWAVLVALLLWAVPFTHATGGRDHLAVTWALLSLVPALVLVRPWRGLRGRDALAVLPALVATVMCVVGRTGFDGATTVAALAYAGLLYVVVRAYLDLDGRVTLVVSALLVGGLDQFFASWWPWYGRGDSASLMVGTFYWHNQFAVFLAATGLLGAAVAARGSGRVRYLGGAVAVLAVPSLAFAGSRSTLALFVLAWAALVLVSLRRRQALAVLVAVPVAGFALSLLIASPVFMHTSNGVAANVEQRETLSGNGSARVAYDRAAAHLALRHPLTGTGFGSFAGASAPMLPSNMQPTLYVHDGFMQAFVDGGVLLGGTVLVVALLPLLAGARRVWRSRLARTGDTTDGFALGALAALALLAAHSAVDADWTYPSLVALYAILAAVVVDRLPRRAGSPVRRFAPVGAVAVLLTLVVALPSSVLAATAADPGAPVPAWAQAASLGLPVSDPPAWAVGSQTCEGRLRVALATPNRTAAVEDALGRGLACSAVPAQDQPSVQITRARALVALGRTADGQALAADLVARYGTRIPQLLVVQALLPHDAGDDAAARRALGAVQTDPRVVAKPEALAFAQSLLAQLSPASAPATTGSGS